MEVFQGLQLTDRVTIDEIRIRSFITLEFIMVRAYFDCGLNSNDLYSTKFFPSFRVTTTAFIISVCPVPIMNKNFCVHDLQRFFSRTEFLVLQCHHINTTFNYQLFNTSGTKVSKFDYNHGSLSQRISCRRIACRSSGRKAQWKAPSIS